MKKLLMMEGCALCSITHGIAGEKPEFLIWKRSVGVPIEYVHRDEMPAGLVDAGAVGRGGGQGHPCRRSRYCPAPRAASLARGGRALPRQRTGSGWPSHGP